MAWPGVPVPLRVGVLFWVIRSSRRPLSLKLLNCAVGGSGTTGGGVTTALFTLKGSALFTSAPSWLKLPAASLKRSLVTNTKALVLLVPGVRMAV